MSTVHILEIKDSDDWGISCLGVDDTCRAWMECQEPDCDFEELERLCYEEGQEKPTLHGVMHMRLPTYFGVPTEGCIVQYDSGDAVEEFIAHHVPEGRSEPGKYLIAHEIDGDTGAVSELIMVGDWRRIDPKEAVSITLEDFPYTPAPLNELNEPCWWPWEPQQLKGVPMGQYHCGYCGGYAMAGIEHFDNRGMDEKHERDMRSEEARGVKPEPIDLGDPFVDVGPFVDSGTVSREDPVTREIEARLRARGVRSDKEPPL
jgi:hypothetical protein